MASVLTKILYERFGFRIFHFDRDIGVETGNCKHPIFAGRTNRGRAAREVSPISARLPENGSMKAILIVSSA
jgi:hypothetical protein